MSNVSAEMAVKSARAHDVTDEAKKQRNWLFIAATAWLILVAAVVILGEWLPFVTDPNEKNASAIRQGPSWDHWFGTASFGQDVFSRVVVGGRISLFVGAMVTLIGIVIGGLLGLLAGYLRGWTDSTVRLIISVTLSIPALLLVIFLVTINDQSLWSVIIAVSLLAIPSLARIVRASTLQVAERDFVKAAQVLGVKKGSILWREVLPNVMPTLISFAFLTFGIILVVESSLSFLQLSVKPPAITWGSIIAEGRIKFDETPHMVFLPGLVLFLTVLSLNVVGDQLLKRFDIKESGL
ncbi:MAG: ABC transporter permease [Ilumatobacter fluminis]|uniref:Peptide/nickel transport system permease protein n=1 Tax=Ilumatobacter fluminis TaxID=467091 RepID=A0A4R7I5Q5_9ACTN|nr:ABC transporter permease [Ilumatobacter fluminis]TDT18033.1 peptide/nickel transport system permease protein [Ilumatobacter fluminis]